MLGALGRDRREILSLFRGAADETFAGAQNVGKNGESDAWRSQQFTRRRMAGGLAALAVLGKIELSWAQGTPAAGTPGTAGFPITISHAFGETVIPAPATRIALTNDLEGLDSVLALGMEPVAVAFTGGYIGALSPWAIAAGAEDVATFETAGAAIDFEAFAAAQPDLILATWIDQDTYDILSSIAPTLVIKNADVTTWQDIQLMVGAATGRTAQAEQKVAETEALIAGQKDRLVPYLDQTVAVAYFWFDEFLVNGKTAPISRILDAFGMTVISPGVAAVGEIDMLSIEQVRQVEEANILIAPDFVAEQTAAQEANILYRALPAVQNGGYVVLSPEMAQALYTESALSMQWAIPRLVDAVIAAAEGEGKRLAE